MQVTPRAPTLGLPRGGAGRRIGRRIFLVLSKRPPAWHVELVIGESMDAPWIAPNRVVARTPRLTHRTDSAYPVGLTG
jgi:hypothetical protein